MNSTRQHVFPFFVGCGRSGTTLLRAMFDSHREMAIPGESLFIASMGSRERRYGRGSAFDIGRFVDELIVHPRFVQWGLLEQSVREAMKISSPDCVSDAIRTLFALYATSHGKRRYGDKTPVYVLAIPLLARLFPEARFVHLIRDGRDVALSLRELPWGSERLTRAALYWKRHVKRGRMAGASLGPDRYREVRFEALIDEPEQVLRELCPFVDLDFDPAMLRYFGRSREFAASFSDIERDIHRNLERPPTVGLRDSRSQTSPAELALIEAVIGDLLEELGYERAMQAPALSLRLAARREMFSESASRVRHRVAGVVGELLGGGRQASHRS